MTNSWFHSITARVLAAFVVLLFVGVRPAAAIPMLQLDIAGAVYDQSTETVTATTDTFSLYAYLTPKSNVSQQALYDQIYNTTYYIAAAVVPKMSAIGCPNPGGCGSFSIGSPSIIAANPNTDPLPVYPNAMTVDVTADMVYGNPPFESTLAAQGHDPGDLAKHGIYDTYYKEFAIKFGDVGRGLVPKGTAIYNTQEQTGQTPGSSTCGYHPDGSDANTLPDLDVNCMYYVKFDISTSLLQSPYQIHFDLYSESLRNGGDIDIDNFAPFSHDAISKVGAFNLNLPEPSSLLLIGTGLALLTRRRATSAARAILQRAHEKSADRQT